jgi:magnesium transporter
MISARRYASDVTEIDLLDVKAALDEPASLVWVDTTDPDDGELSLLEESFQLDPLIADDIRDRHPRPTLEHYGTHALVVAYSSTLVEVDFIIGPNWLITVREESEASARWPIEGPLARYERTRCEDVTAGFLLYVLLDALVDGHVDETDELDDRIEAIEDRIFAETAASEHAVQQELYEIRRRLLELRHAVAPLRDVVAALLRREVAPVHSEAVLHLQDVYDHVLRVVDVIDTQRELVGNGTDAHLAVIANQLTANMKKTTTWGAILLGSSLVAGVYGMNFTHMPQLERRYGMLFALGVMAVITAAGYLVFRRRDYL